MCARMIRPRIRVFVGAGELGSGGCWEDDVDVTPAGEMSKKWKS